MPTALKPKSQNTKSSKKAAAKKSAPKTKNVAQSVETGDKKEKAYYVKGVIETLRDGGKQFYGRLRYTPAGAKKSTIAAVSLSKKAIEAFNAKASAKFEGVVDAGKTFVLQGYHNNMPAREGYKTSRAFNAFRIVSIA